MATLLVALPNDPFTSQSEFTLVMGTLAGFFATAGWVQTADTGQINMSTSMSGYQIWRLNDSLQSTAPWFMRITYGAVGAAFNFQFGQATDGAGNLTGSQISGVFALTNFFGTTIPQRCYLSGDTNRLAWTL